MLLPLVIADQSAGGLAKPAEGAGGDAETRSFPKDDFRVELSLVDVCGDDRMSLPSRIYVRFMRPFMQPSPEIEARIRRDAT